MSFLTSIIKSGQSEGIIEVIEKDSSVPMYEQIATLLKSDILQKKIAPSGNIGTHAELAQRFGVSLITIRKAIRLLADDGLIDIVQGKGTFAKSTVLQDPLTRLTGASNIISEKHLAAKVEVPTFEIIETPGCFDAAIKKGLGPKCLRIERLHLVEGVRTAYAEIFIPQKYGEHITKADVEGYTIYQIYENKWQLQLGKGKQTIRADRASARAAKALDIEEGWPVLSIIRRAYSATGDLVEYMFLTYEYTQYSFDVELMLSSH